MAELTTIKRDDVFTDSWTIAENIGREHASVTIMIKRYESDLRDLGTLFSFSTASRKTTGGRPAQIYELNEQQAIFLMTLMDNSPEVIAFKKRLAMSFVAMRKVLLERQSSEWQTARIGSKVTRRNETDAIKRLIEYAKEQGSTHADKLYMTYSKLVKSNVGYADRDSASAVQLYQIIAFESIIDGLILRDIGNNVHYKAIYQNAKEELTHLKRLWSVPALTNGGLAA